MTIHFDEKGKFFTNIISKEAVSTVIQTLTHRVRGKVYVRPEERLKDEVNQSEQFLAVTDAVIYDSSNTEVLKVRFLAINRDHIVWLAPEDELSENLLHRDMQQSGGSE
jgi:hypothetical protein